jgi:hypothetical protein
MQTNTQRKKIKDTTFKNPDTRERWEWVQQAISFAESDSRRELESRYATPVEPAMSPFVE